MHTQITIRPEAGLIDLLRRSRMDREVPVNGSSGACTACPRLVPLQEIIFVLLVEHFLFFRVGSKICQIRCVPGFELPFLSATAGSTCPRESARRLFQ
jgi:hypothetical protein